MKKGFTLVELLGVIIVLAVIAIIVFPLVNKTIKTNKEKLYNSQLEEIKSGAEKWAYANIEMLPVNDGESVTITLFELKKGGFLTLDIRNPITGELLPNDMVITITFKNNNFEINVDGNSGSDIDSEVNKNSPIIILNGNFIEYVEINGTYEEKGALAKDKDGNIIQDIQISYQLNGVEIPSIDTKSFNTYTAIYSATSNGYTSRITRTIVVRDTTAPDLVVPGTIELLKEELASFDLLEGVSATDNSGEDIKIETRGFDRLPTDKIIEYTACDSHNNCVTKRRLVKVVMEDNFTMQPVNFNYTGSEQSFIVPHTGYYKLEAWGAQGGSHNGGIGGLGAYTDGTIYLTKGEILYIYVGGAGSNSSNTSGGYNGGGYSKNNLVSGVGATGGGATDIRFKDNDVYGRIMVAAGGSASEGYDGKPGGSLTGIIYGGTSATQVAGGTGNYGDGTFGYGAVGTNCSGAGGGYYGGGTNKFTLNYDTYGGGEGATIYFTGIKTVRYGKTVFAYKMANKSISCGNSIFGDPQGGVVKECRYSSSEIYVSGSGSSFISGHLGCIAIEENGNTTPRLDSNNVQCTTTSALSDVKCSYHYTNKIFENTNMISGINEGNGKVKISYVGQSI